MAQGKHEVPESAVVKKSIKAVGYEVGGGSTKVVFVGAPAAPNASGEAKVEAQKSGTSIKLKVQGLPRPTALGSEFLTYVLWAVTPDGSTTNLGEIFIDKNGEGIQHIALRVDNVEAAIADLKGKGVRMIDEVPRYGAGGASIAFVHPKSTGGILLELSQRK